MSCQNFKKKMLCIDNPITRWRTGLTSKASPLKFYSSILLTTWWREQNHLRDVFFYQIINYLDTKIWVPVKCFKVWLPYLCKLSTDCFSQSSRIVVFELCLWSQMTWGDIQGAGALQEKAPAPLPPLINTSITLFMKYIGFVGIYFI